MVVQLCQPVKILEQSKLQANESEPHGRKIKIAIIGDSNSSGFLVDPLDSSGNINGPMQGLVGKLAHQRNNWVAQLGRLMEEKYPGKYDVVNTAHSGQQILGNYQLPQFKGDMDENADIYLMFMGKNDVWHIPGDWFTEKGDTPSDAMASERRLWRLDMKHDFEMMYDRLKSLPSNPQVYIMNIFPLSKNLAAGGNRQFEPQFLAHKVETLNDYIKSIYPEIWGELKLDDKFFIDINTAATEEMKKGTNIYSDGYHAGLKGQTLIAKTVFDRLTGDKPVSHVQVPKMEPFDKEINPLLNHWLVEEIDGFK